MSYGSCKAVSSLTISKKKNQKIIVDIDNKNMPADQQITPSNVIKLYGKVDKRFVPSKLEVDVKVIEVQKN